MKELPDTVQRWGKMRNMMGSEWSVRRIAADRVRDNSFVRVSEASI
jgi:hypothetical protein